MDRNVLISILNNLCKINLNGSNKNKLLNLAEEYIEWINISKKRFCHNNKYSYTLDTALCILKDYQSDLLLNNYNDALNTLNNTIPLL